MTSAEGIIEKLKPVFDEDTAIIAAYLFGSRVQGRERPGSDVDIAVLVDDRGYRQDRKALLDRLLPSLGRLLRLDVHILILNDASYLARIEVLSRGRLIYVKDDLVLAQFRTMSYVQFAEYAPYLRQLQEKLKQRLGISDHGE
jgi:uncharacterized protein